MDLYANIQWQPDSPTGDGSEEPRRPSGLRLRPATPQDLAFQRQLYHQRRQGELANVSWTTTDEQAFCDLQFMLQRADWAQRYPQARHWLLCRDADGVATKPVGLLIWVREAGTLRVIDIALQPEWRGRGWGTRLLQGLMQEADSAPIRLCVERTNPALNLYRRLGFVVEDASDALRLQLVWQAPAAAASTASASATAVPMESAPRHSLKQEPLFQSSRE